MKTTTVLKTHKRHYVTEMNSVCVYYEDLLLLYATPVGFKLNWMLPLPAKEQVRGGKEQFQTPASAGAQTASLTISPCPRQAADLERGLQTPATLPSQQVGSMKSSFHLARHTLIPATRMPSWKEGNSAAPKRRNGEGPEWSLSSAGPGVPHLPWLGVPSQGTAEPLPLPRSKGLRLPPLSPEDFGCRLGPGDPGPEATPRPSPLGPDRRPLPRAPPGRPCPAARSPLQARGRPAPPAPTGGPHTVWDCRLWLASMAAVSGTVSSSSTLPAGGFSMKAIPGRRSATASGPGAGTRGADSCRPPGSAAAAAVNTRRPTRRRRRPPSPRGPSADLPPPPWLSAQATLSRCHLPRGPRAKPSQSQLSWICASKLHVAARRARYSQHSPQTSGQFTLSTHPQRSSEPDRTSWALGSRNAQAQTFPWWGFSC